eukprot:scaffold487649_cov37-Prasinocladus_malaysianus.AAC.1
MPEHGCQSRPGTKRPPQGTRRPAHMRQRRSADSQRSVEVLCKSCKDSPEGRSPVRQRVLPSTRVTRRLA